MRKLTSHANVTMDTNDVALLGGAQFCSGRDGFRGSLDWSLALVLRNNQEHSKILDLEDKLQVEGGVFDAGLCSLPPPMGSSAVK